MAHVALTGGATGIGASVAAKMTRDGHEVTVFDIIKPTADVANWVKTDLNDPASIANAVAGVDGPFDVLINNAGLPPKEGLAELVLAVNWFGFTAFLETMLPQLAAGASIINTASRAGAHWRDNMEEVRALISLERADLPQFIAGRNMDATRAYNLSKEAVIVSTMARTEDMVRRGFRMNSVSPAAVSTGILDDFVAAFGDRVAKNITRVGRPGTADEVADVIAFLASPQSHWIKGQDIVVDGGMSAIGASEALGLS
ncbi:MAG: SDR family oxidoreductase [Pseudomonadota bacterium]